MKYLSVSIRRTARLMFYRCFLYGTILSVCAGVLPGMHGEAAVAPNGQSGACGPYYLWFQVSPDSYPSLIEYIDLCGITFDISDIVNDFDFVYFTDTAKLQRAALDLNQDGISDRYFAGRTENLLEWKPEGGCVRIPLRECQGTAFHDRCGYAMISVQPKRGFREGSARIPIGVHAKCPPAGTDCSRTYMIVHEYSGCFSAPLPEFIVQKHANLIDVTRDSDIIYFQVDVQNAGGSEQNNTIVTNTIGTGTNGGTLRLVHLDVDCPRKGTCAILSVDTTHIKVALQNIPPNQNAHITYRMQPKRSEIPLSEVSYFTNTATLSTGGSARATVSVFGTGESSSGEPERRPERPRNP